MLYFPLLLLFGCGSNDVLEETHGNYALIHQSKGPTLGYSPASGVEILYEGGLAFKDLNRNGALDPYEDWRLDAQDRAADLARQLSVTQICGLMMYSSAVHLEDDALTQKQLEFLDRDYVRHVLVASVKDTFRNT